MINPFEDILTILNRIEGKLNAPASAGAQSAPPIEIIDTSILCQRLNISEPTIIRMRKRKALPYLVIGSAIRYDWHAVVKALENKRK